MVGQWMNEPMDGWTEERMDKRIAERMSDTGRTEQREEWGLTLTQKVAHTRAVQSRHSAWVSRSDTTEG